MDRECLLPHGGHHKKLIDLLVFLGHHHEMNGHCIFDRGYFVPRFLVLSLNLRVYVMNDVMMLLKLHLAWVE